MKTDTDLSKSKMPKRRWGLRALAFAVFAAAFGLTPAVHAEHHERGEDRGKEEAERGKERGEERGEDRGDDKKSDGSSGHDVDKDE